MTVVTPADRQVLRATFARIAAEHDGKLTVDAVVKEGRQPESSIHRYWDWDVERAAYAAWAERARELIRLIRVTVLDSERREVSAPVWVHDPDTRDDAGGGYVSVEVLVGDRAWARRALVEECQRVVSLLARVRGIAVGLHLERDVDGVIASLGAVIAKAVRRSGPRARKKAVRGRRGAR